MKEFFLISGLLILIFIASENSIRMLSRLLLSLFKTRSRVIKWLASIFLPGTFIHETGHLLFAEGLMVRTNDLNIIPEIKNNNEVKLGGVQIEKTDPIRRTIIGFAPVLFGLIIIWIATYYFEVFHMNLSYQLIYVYILFQVCHTMFSSRKDLEGAVIGLIFIALLLLLFKYLANIIIFAPIILARTRVENFFTANLFYLKNGLLYGLIIVISFNLLLWLILKLRKKI